MTVVAGVDLAFRRNSSSLAIVRLKDGKAHVERVEERKPSKGRPLIPSEVCAEFASIAKAAGARDVVADGHYIETLREHVTAAGLILVDAPQPSLSWPEVARYATEGLVSSVPHERLRRQFEGVRFVYLSGGHVQVELPSSAEDDSHGDLAAAAHLGIWRVASTARLGRVAPVPTKIAGARRERLSY